MGQNQWTKRNQNLSLAGIKYWRADWLNSIHYVAGDGVHSLSTGAAYICILEHTSDVSTEPGVGAAWHTVWQVLVDGSNSIEVNQDAHGLAIMQPVKSAGINGEYNTARANTLANAQAIGIVTEIIDANNFRLTESGYVKNSAVPNLPAGTVLYLDPAFFGGLTQTKPNTFGQFIKPMAIIVTAGLSMWVLSDSPIECGVQYEYSGVLGAPDINDLEFTGSIVVTRLGRKLTINVPGSGGAHVIEQDGTPLLAEPALNFVNFFILSDVFGVSTNVDLDTAAIANDSTFISTLTNNTTFINDLTTNSTFISNIISITAAGGIAKIDQTPDNGTYGLLAGVVDGANTTYTVSLGVYASGTLAVYKDGILQEQGLTKDWVETLPGSGTFDFNTAPTVGSVITAIYATTIPLIQSGIQFDDETGNPLGSAGTADEFEITGGGVAGTRVGNKILYTLPAPSGGAGANTVNADETVFDWFTTVVPAPLLGRAGFSPWNGTWGVPQVHGDWGTIGLTNHAGNLSGDLATDFAPANIQKIKWRMQGGTANPAKDFYTLQFGDVILEFHGWTVGQTVMHFVYIPNGTDIPLASTYIDSLHLYEISWDGTNVTLYIDGIQRAQTPQVGSPGGTIGFNMAQDPSGGGGDSSMHHVSQFIVSRHL